jgi:hypothetical protein
MKKRAFILGAVFGGAGGLVWGLVLVKDSLFWTLPLSGLIIGALVGLFVGLGVSGLIPAPLQQDRDSDQG